VQYSAGTVPVGSVDQIENAEGAMEANSIARPPSRGTIYFNLD